MTLFVDQWKKILKNKLYPLILGTVLLIVVSSFALVNLLVYRLESPYEPFLKQQRVEDFHITFGQIEYQFLTGSQRLTVCTQLQIIECVGLDESDPVQVNHINRIIQERIYRVPEVYDQLYEPLMLPLVEAYDLEIERSVFVNIDDLGNTYRFISVNTAVNIPYVHQGRLPEGVDEVAIYEAFAKRNNLAINDTLVVLDKAYTINGFFYTPDHILPSLTSHTLNYQAETQTVVLAVEEAVFALERPFVVKYQGIGDFALLSEDFSIQGIQNAELRFLGRNMQMVRSVLPREMNFKINAVVLETELARLFASAFMIVFVGVTVVVVLMYLKRFIEDQKRDLTILRHLGYSDHALSVPLMSLPLLLSGVILLGFILGTLLSIGLFPIYAGRYQMPYAPFSMPTTLFGIGLVMPMLVLLGSSFVFIRYWLSTMHRGKHVTKWTLRLRSVRRGSVSLLMFTLVSFLLLFAMFAQSLIGRYKAETMLGNHYEHIVILSRFSNQLRSESEGFTSVNGKVVQIDERFLEGFSVQLYGIDTEGDLKRMIDDDVSSNALLNDGVIVSKNLAESENLIVGQVITLRIGSVTVQETIVGVHNDLIERAVYFERGALNALLGYDESYFNGYYSTREEIEDSEALLVLNYQTIAGELETMLRLSNQLTLGLMSLALVVALSLFYFMTMNRLREERFSFMTLKALGYLDKEMYVLFYKKTWMLISFAFMFSAFFVSFAINILLDVLKTRSGFVFVSPSYLMPIFISYLGVSLLMGVVTYLVYVQFRNVDISTALKQ